MVKRYQPNTNQFVIISANDWTILKNLEENNNTKNNNKIRIKTLKRIKIKILKNLVIKNIEKNN